MTRINQVFFRHFLLTVFIALSKNDFAEGYFKHDENEDGRNYTFQDSHGCLHYISKRGEAAENNDHLPLSSYFNCTNRRNYMLDKHRKHSNSILSQLSKTQFSFIPCQTYIPNIYSKVGNIQTENVTNDLSKALLNGIGKKEKNNTLNRSETVTKEIPTANNEPSRKSNSSETKVEELKINQTNFLAVTPLKMEGKYRMQDKLKSLFGGEKGKDGKNRTTTNSKDEQRKHATTEHTSIEIHFVESVSVSNTVAAQGLGVTLGSVNNSTEQVGVSTTIADIIYTIKNTSQSNDTDTMNNLSTDEATEIDDEEYEEANEIGVDTKKENLEENRMNNEQKPESVPEKPENRKTRSLYPNPVDFQQFHLMHGLYPTNRALLDEALRTAELQASLVASNFQKAARLRQQQQMDPNIQPDEFESHHPEESNYRDDEFENKRKQTKRTSVNFEYPQNRFDEKLKQRINFLKNLNSAITKKREELNLLDKKILNEASLKPSENCAALNSEVVLLNDAENINKMKGRNEPHQNEDNLIKNSVSNDTGYKFPNISQTKTFYQHPEIESALKSYFNNYFPVPDNLNLTRPQIKESFKQDFLESVKEPVSFETNMNASLNNLSRKVSADEEMSKKDSYTGGIYTDFYSPSKVRQKRWIFHRPIGKERDKIIEEKISATKIEMVNPDFSKMLTGIEDDLNKLKNVVTNFNHSSDNNEDKNFYVQVNVSLSLFNETSTPSSMNSNEQEVHNSQPPSSGSTDKFNWTDSSTQSSTELKARNTICPELMRATSLTEATEHTVQPNKKENTRSKNKTIDFRDNKKKNDSANGKKVSLNKSSTRNNINVVSSFNDESNVKFMDESRNRRKRRSVSVPGTLSKIHISGRIINPNFTEERSPSDTQICKKMSGITYLHPSKSILENRLKNTSKKKGSDPKPALYIKNIRSAPNMESRLNTAAKADVKNCTIFLNKNNLTNERKMQDDPPSNLGDELSYNLLNELISMNPSIFDIIKDTLNTKKRNSQSISNFEIKFHE